MNFPHGASSHPSFHLLAQPQPPPAHADTTSSGAPRTSGSPPRRPPTCQPAAAPPPAAPAPPSACAACRPADTLTPAASRPARVRCQRQLELRQRPEQWNTSLPPPSPCPRPRAKSGNRSRAPGVCRPPRSSVVTTDPAGPDPAPPTRPPPAGPPARPPSPAVDPLATSELFLAAAGPQRVRLQRQFLPFRRNPRVTDQHFIPPFPSRLPYLLCPRFPCRFLLQDCHGPKCVAATEDAPPEGSLGGVCGTTLGRGVDSRARPV